MSGLIYRLLFCLWGFLDYDLLRFISIQFNTSSVNWDEPSNSDGEIKPSSSVSMDINHAGCAFAVLNFLKTKVWKTIYSNYIRYVYNWVRKKRNIPYPSKYLDDREKIYASASSNDIFRSLSRSMSRNFKALYNKQWV